jgi:hypothetical protein
VEVGPNFIGGNSNPQITVEQLSEKPADEGTSTATELNQRHRMQGKLDIENLWSALVHTVSQYDLPVVPWK